MIKRAFATLSMMRQHKTELKQFCNDHERHVSCIVDIDLNFFANHGVKIIALDFDGVLASHGQQRVHGLVMVWMEKLVQQYGADKICILSNKPTKGRKRFFEAHYPGVEFISATRKKPYPDGLQAIAALKHVDPSEICLVDDRLLTGVLATIVAGSQAIYVDKPYQDFSKQFIHECFFEMLRSLEKRWLRYRSK